MSTGLNAGDMDREIVLQTAAFTQDAETGETVPDWANATEETIWAEWLPANSREAWNAQERLRAYVDGVYRIYDKTPRPSPTLCRILGHDGRTYDIRPWEEIRLGEGLEIPVVARAD